MLHAHRAPWASSPAEHATPKWGGVDRGVNIREPQTPDRGTLRERKACMKYARCEGLRLVRATAMVASLAACDCSSSNRSAAASTSDAGGTAVSDAIGAGGASAPLG